MNCSTIQLQHRREGQSGIQSSIKHLVQELAAVLFDVPHSKNRPSAKNTSLCTGLQYNHEQFQHTRACIYVRLLQQLGKDLSHTHPKKYPERMQFLFIAIDTACNMSLTTSKKAHTDNGPRNHSCSKQSFWKGTKQQTNYAWMSVMEYRRRKWRWWYPAAHHPQTQRWITDSGIIGHLHHE